MQILQNDKTTLLQSSTSMTRRRRQQRKRLIALLAWCLTLSGLLVVYVHFVCRQALPTTVEEPAISEVLTTSQIEISTSLPTNLGRSLPTPEKYTEDELFCMAAVIYNEAGADACSDTHRRFVGYVVLNRVNDSRYPNSVREVLEQKGQYQGMGNGVRFAKRYSNPTEKHAVERAYQIAREVLENRNNIPIPANVLFQAQFVQGTRVYTQIGNTFFCYAEEVN